MIAAPGNSSTETEPVGALVGGLMGGPGAEAVGALLSDDPADAGNISTVTPPTLLSDPSWDAFRIVN